MSSDLDYAVDRRVLDLAYEAARRGNIALAARDWIQAIAHFRSAQFYTRGRVESAFLQAVVWMKLGRSLFESGAFEEGRSAFENAAGVFRGFKAGADAAVLICEALSRSEYDPKLLLAAEVNEPDLPSRRFPLEKLATVARNFVERSRRFYAQGHETESQQALELAIRIYRRFEGAGGEIGKLRCKQALRVGAGRLEEEEFRWTKALEFRNDLSVFDCSSAYESLIRIRRRVGDAYGSLAYANSALEHYRLRGFPLTFQIKIYELVARICAEAEIPGAASALKDAIMLAGTSDEGRTPLTRLHSKLGLLLSEEDYLGAIREYSESIRGDDDVVSASGAWKAIAEIHRRVGNYDQAEVSLGAAYELLKTECIGEHGGEEVGQHRAAQVLEALAEILEALAGVQLERGDIGGFRNTLRLARDLPGARNRRPLYRLVESHLMRVADFDRVANLRVEASRVSSADARHAASANQRRTALAAYLGRLSDRVGPTTSPLKIIEGYRDVTREVRHLGSVADGMLALRATVAYGLQVDASTQAGAAFFRYFSLECAGYGEVSMAILMVRRSLTGNHGFPFDRCLAFIHLADLYARSGDRAQASSSLQIALRILRSPSISSAQRTRVWLKINRTYRNLGQCKVALAVLIEAIASCEPVGLLLSPTDEGRILEEVGYTYREMRLEADARTAWADAIATIPDAALSSVRTRSRLQALIAGSLASTGNYSEALEAYGDARSLLVGTLGDDTTTLDICIAEVWAQQGLTMAGGPERRMSLARALTMFISCLERSEAHTHLHHSEFSRRQAVARLNLGTMFSLASELGDARAVSDLIAVTRGAEPLVLLPGAWPVEEVFGVFFRRLPVPNLRMPGGRRALHIDRSWRPTVRYV